MKKMICGFSVVMVLMLLIGNVYANPINNLDSASSWAKDGITAAVGKGFVPVDLQNNYTKVITRQEFCRMAVKWVEYATSKNIDAVLAEKGLTRNQNAFSDTKDSDILAAFALGITSGTTAPTATTPGTFTPNGQFSREQAATMIMNTCKAIGVNVDNPPASGFNDLNTASSWAVNGINFVRANGIMQGTSTNPPIFSPKADYTREQSIITFNNIDFDKIGISNSNPSIYIDIVGVWMLEKFALFENTISENEYKDFFPAGTPYLRFNNGNTVEIFNFSVEYDINTDMYIGITDFGTYNQNGNSITVTDSGGNDMTFSQNGEVLTQQTDCATMSFR